MMKKNENEGEIQWIDLASEAQRQGPTSQGRGAHGRAVGVHRAVAVAFESLHFSSKIDDFKEKESIEIAENHLKSLEIL